MSESPFQRAAREGRNADDTGSRGRKKRRRRSKPKPTSKEKGKRQSTKERYARAREDAQLEGVIPTIPDGGVRGERVPPSAQGNQVLAVLIADAVRRGWQVPEGVKPKLVDEMMEVILDPLARTKDKIASFNALRMADRSQWEQDNPVDAGKARGASSTVAVSVQNNVLAAQVMREAIERGFSAGDLGLPAPGEPRGIGDSRFDGEVEVGAASTTDQRGVGEGVDDAQQPDPNYRTIPAR